MRMWSARLPYWPLAFFSVSCTPQGTHRLRTCACTRFCNVRAALHKANAESPCSRASFDTTSSIDVMATSADAAPLPGSASSVDPHWMCSVAASDSIAELLLHEGLLSHHATSLTSISRVLMLHITAQRQSFRFIVRQPAEILCTMCAVLVCRGREGGEGWGRRECARNGANNAKPKSAQGTAGPCVFLPRWIAQVPSLFASRQCIGSRQRRGQSLAWPVAGRRRGHRLGA